MSQQQPLMPQPEYIATRLVSSRLVSRVACEESSVRTRPSPPPVCTSLPMLILGFGSPCLLPLLPTTRIPPAWQPL